MYKCIFHYGNTGFLELKLRGYPGVWPAMMMLSDGEDYWLHLLTEYKPVDVMLMGGRGGFIDSGDLKPFWPFRLVGDSSKPELTPVLTRSHLTYFESPALPPDFEWKGDAVEVFFDVEVLADGKVKILNHSVHEEIIFIEGKTKYVVPNLFRFQTQIGGGKLLRLLKIRCENGYSSHQVKMVKQFLLSNKVGLSEHTRWTAAFIG